jgi:hypothetical protein
VAGRTVEPARHLSELLEAIITRGLETGASCLRATYLQ